MSELTSREERITLVAVAPLMGILIAYLGVIAWLHYGHLLHAMPKVMGDLVGGLKLKVTAKFS